MHCHSMITYNRLDLLRIGRSIVTGCYLLIDACVAPLRPLERANNRRTHRGFRAGRSKQRPIPVLITPHFPSSVIVRCETYTSNLIRLDSVCDIPSVRQVCFCLLNARSVGDAKQAGKATVICDLIEDNDLDILAITETWLSADDSFSTGCITPAGYQLRHVPRTYGTGGGVAVVYKSGFTMRHLEMPKSKTFESMCLQLGNDTQSVHLLVVYRPPPNSKNGFITAEFLLEFGDLLDSMSMYTSNMLIAGDFNFHMDNTSDNDTKRFQNILNAADLTQHVEVPTHVAEHTIDLLITRSSDTFLNNIRTDIPHMSDHSAIHCTLQLVKPPNVRVTTTSRNYRHINTTAICDEIRSLLLSNHLSDDMNHAVDMYNETIAAIIDKQAPLKNRTVIVRPHTPWYNDGIRSQKCVRRQLERTWRKSGLESDRLAYCLQRQLVTSSVHRAKLEYHTNQIANASGDQKQLFKIVAKLLHTDKKDIENSV